MSKTIFPLTGFRDHFLDSFSLFIGLGAIFHFKKNTGFQSMLGWVGMAFLTNRAVRIGEIQLHGGPWSYVWLEEIEDADVFFGERFTV
jgi:hypothetical protein